MVRVHSEGNVRLSSIPPEVSFADKDSQQKSDVKG